VLFLRDGGSGEDEEGEEASGGAHERLFFCGSVSHWWRVRCPPPEVW
jgi:hypothetical protein